jgi:hypothetical protein
MPIYSQQNSISFFTLYSKTVHWRGTGSMAALLAFFNVEDSRLFESAFSPAEIPGWFPTRVRQGGYYTN